MVAQQLLPTSVAAGSRIAPPLREHLAADDTSDCRALDPVALQAGAFPSRIPSLDP